MRISDWSSDVCSSDLDGTSDLRQAFATVLATGSSYGANHLIDVLLGRRTEKIEMAGHCDVKTFGAGVLHSRDRWRSLFRQALTGGLLETNHARGGALGLTEKGWEVVQGKRKVAVTAPPTRSAPSLAPVRAHSPEGLPDR